MSTMKIFQTNSYQKEFTAILLEITPKGIVIDQTCFYPESGGQPGDKGHFEYNGHKVLIKNTRNYQGKIVHETTENEIPLGTELTFQIDWNHRYTLMKLHSAQHVISRYFQNTFSAETISTQLKTTKSRVDFQPIKKFFQDQIRDTTQEINEILASGLEVKVSNLPRKEAFEFLKAKDYQIQYLQMVPKSIKNIRVVSIGDYDFAACGGTHVTNTSEIGKIKFLSTKNKGKLRERFFYTLDLDN
jgi:Ser-tRNA(Ala) deacylase AlaX